MYRTLFAVVAIVLFLLDLILVLVGAVPPQLIQVFMFGGLASLAATQLPVP